MPPIKYIDGALWQNTHGYLAHKLVKPSVPNTNSNTNIHHHISNKHKFVKCSIPTTNSNTSSHIQTLFTTSVPRDKKICSPKQTQAYKHFYKQNVSGSLSRNTLTGWEKSGLAVEWLISIPVIVNSNICSVVICNPNHCKSLPFFYFLTFKKGRLLYTHPVGWSVGWLVDVTIDFFQHIQYIQYTTEFKTKDRNSNKRFALFT